MASKANFAWGAPLPFYPGENVTGAYLTLTQSPCNNPWRKGLCCGYPRESEGKAARAAHAPICSNWTGAHPLPTDNSTRSHLGGRMRPNNGCTGRCSLREAQP